MILFSKLSMQPIDLVFILLLHKYGVEETIDILKIRDDPKYKDAIEEDLKYKRVTLPKTRSVYSQDDQIKWIHETFKDDVAADIIDFTAFHGGYKVDHEIESKPDIRYLFQLLQKKFKSELVYLIH